MSGKKKPAPAPTGLGGPASVFTNASEAEAYRRLKDQGYFDEAKPAGALPAPDRYNEQVADGISDRYAQTMAQRAAQEAYERAKAQYDYEKLQYDNLDPVRKWLTQAPVAPVPPGGALGTQRGGR